MTDVIAVPDTKVSARHYTAFEMGVQSLNDYLAADEQIKFKRYVVVRDEYGGLWFDVKPGKEADPVLADLLGTLLGTNVAEVEQAFAAFFLGVHAGLDFADRI